MVEPESHPSLEQLEKLYKLTLSATERELLSLYVEILRHWGRRINLAGPALLAQPYPHLLEAVWACRQGLVGPGRVLDVGSGCGIPGIIFAIAEPEIEVLLIERNQKKAVFLREVIRQLGLSARVFERGFEEFAEWNHFGLVTLRALKPAPGLLERLAGASLALAWFRGGEASLALPGFELEKERQVPGSVRRWLSVFLPTPGQVSRET